MSSVVSFYKLVVGSLWGLVSGMSAANIDFVGLVVLFLVHILTLVIDMLDNSVCVCDLIGRVDMHLIIIVIIGNGFV